MLRQPLRGGCQIASPDGTVPIGPGYDQALESCHFIEFKHGRSANAFLYQNEQNAHTNTRMRMFIIWVL
jgi:hypothetical protein